MVTIKEFLPNPVGTDKDGEYLKIFNDGGKTVSLDGWSIKNLSGKSYKLSGPLNSKQELSLPYSETKVPLNNNGETLFLYDEKGILVDKLGYAGGTSLKAGEIIRRDHGLLEKSQLGTSFQNNGLINPPANNQITQVIFIDFLMAIILAGIGLYIILELEKKIEIKLW